MSINGQMDREEEILGEMLEQGEISIQKYNKEMRELQRDYQAAVEEEAQEAYDAVISHHSGWGY